jgi:hypothetical protein
MAQKRSRGKKNRHSDVTERTQALARRKAMERKADKIIFWSALALVIAAVLLIVLL